MADFFYMSDKDMILLSAAVAVLLIDGLNSDQQETLGNFLMCIGQNIVAADSQKTLCENKTAKLEISEKYKKTEYK